MKEKQRQRQKQKKIQNDSNILVAIRIRPLNLKQINATDGDVVRVQDNLIIILDPIEMEFEMENKKMLDVLHRSKEQRYAFDKVYLNQPSETIYQQTTRSLIKTVTQGKNATVFAYGPTGTGKTYTMLGNQQVYGLNVLAIRDIFSFIEVDHEYNYSILITYVQIYNQMIRDLLIPASGYLQLRDDSQKGVSIAGVTQFQAQSTEQVMQLLMIGNKRRTTEATNANQTSSRSHAVFQINVHKTPRTKNINIETLSGKLSLIDLAGSQRGTVTENRGIRLMEGAKINRSLLALANCINALGDKNKKGFFVPYRDSKLTRLLKDSLGGNCKTVMIVNISPASSQFEETINTLKYANRAKNIKTKPMTNKKLISIHISEYKSLINDLRQEIQQLKSKLQKSLPLDPIEANYDRQKAQNILNQRKQGQACTCGRLEENQQIRKIKQRIFENFNDRIQFRKALIEIQEQNSINIVEIKKKQAQMILLKQQQISQQILSNQKSQNIKIIGKTIQTLKLSTQKNILKKQITNIQLLESMAVTKKIREQIPKKVKSKQNREHLEILIKNHILELQNIELQINSQVQQKILADLRTISASNRQALHGTGINLYKLDKDEQELMDLGSADKDDIQLQIQEEEDVDLGEGEDEPNLEDSIIRLNKDAKRNIIQQTYQQKYADDFQDGQKPLPHLFQDAHLDLQPDNKQIKKNSEQNSKVKTRIIQEARQKTRNDQSYTINHKNSSLVDIGSKLQQQAESSKKNIINLNAKTADNNMSFGVVGFNNINSKKRQKSIGNQGINTGISAVNIKSLNKINNTANSSVNINMKQQTVDNTPLQFNLKGINVRLNQKLPFVMAPKEKKKK